MQSRTPTSLHWPQILTSLRKCAGESVLIRDGKCTEPAASMRMRPAANGTELCLFPGESAIARLDLIERLEMLAKSSGRRFMSSAKANVSDAFLLIEDVSDETIDDISYAVINTRRPTLGFNQSQQVGSTTTLRSKRIKNS